MKKKYRCILGVLLSVVLVAGGAGGIYMLLTKKPVPNPSSDPASGHVQTPSSPVYAYPLSPMNATGFGGIAAAIRPSDSLFAGTGTAEAASDVLMEADTDKVAASTDFLKLDGFSQGLADVSHLLFYVKLPAANTVTVTVHMFDRYTNGIHNLSLLPDADYQVLAVNADKWESARTISANGTKAYGGGLTFDGAFEGYVKIPLSSMADEDANFVILPEIDELRGFSIRFEKIGGAYGKAEILPFIVTADGDGKPALPEGWTQTVGADGIVQAAPISDVAVNNTAYKTVSAQLVSSLSPLTDAQGVRMDPGSLTQDGATGGYVQDGNSKQKIYTGLRTGNLPLAGTEGIIFYIKTDTANRVVFTMDLSIPADAGRWRSSWAPVMQMKVGAEYQVLPAGSDQWQKAVTVVGMDNHETWFGAIQFDGAFEGYVKIPYTSLANDSTTFFMNPATDAVSQLVFHVDNIGGEHGSPVIGPAFIVVQDGFQGFSLVSAPERKPETPAASTGNMPTDTQEKIAYILEQSRQGNAQAHYYMIGDSTRYLVGGPVFRLVQDVFSNQYNVECIRHSMGGLKTEHWSGHTPNLQPEWCPTVDWLIDLIPGTGEYCIVDISLGINDTPDHTAQEIAELLEEGIQKLKAAKPDVAVVYTTPNPIIPASSQDKLREAAALLAQKDPSVWIVDVLDDVMDQYYEDYFVDEVHPNREGYRAIAAYILSRYLPDHSYEKITGADYTRVEEALAKIPADLSKYTSQSIKAVNSAKNAVVWGRDSRQQDAVDAWAAAIESAVAALEEKAET